MDDSAIRAALQRLLSHGDAMEDKKLLNAHAAKNAPPPEQCPECKVPLVDGKCPQCGYSAGGDEDEGAMASLLERGAQE